MRKKEREREQSFSFPTIKNNQSWPKKKKATTLLSNQFIYLPASSSRLCTS